MTPRNWEHRIGFVSEARLSRTVFLKAQFSIDSALKVPVPISRRRDEALKSVPSREASKRTVSA
jgi:hypothetical protein